MTKPTGLPRGRRLGSKNKRRRDVEVAELRDTIEALLPDAFHGDAHAFLISVYKDTSLDRRLRIDAAGKALAGHRRDRRLNLQRPAARSRLLDRSYRAPQAPNIFTPIINTGEK
jgi:hypothetical protein